MRVIFWDVDGVLNHPQIWGAWSRLGWPASLDPTLVVRAAEVTKAVGAKCVLSSTWRLGDTGLSKTVNCLRLQGWKSAREDFIDATPHLGTKRGIEIGEWLIEHPDVKEYVIVDDDADMTTHMKRLVQTDHNVGLTARDCERIKELFRVSTTGRAPGC